MTQKLEEHERQMRRDKFAAAALQGILSGVISRAGVGRSDSERQNYAAEAYRYADAMLAASGGMTVAQTNELTELAKRMAKLMAQFSMVEVDKDIVTRKITLSVTASREDANEFIQAVAACREEAQRLGVL